MPGTGLPPRRAWTGEPATPETGRPRCHQRPATRDWTGAADHQLPPPRKFCNTPYSLLIVSQWTNQRETRQNIAWAKETFETLRPHMTDRSYVNNLTAEDGQKVHEVWGANYRRLVTVKRRYDPEQRSSGSTTT